MTNDDESESDVLARAEERRRAIAAQIAGRPVEDVIGVVDPSGRGGWQRGNKWTLSFTFHSWKVSAGPMKTRALSVQATSSRKRFDSLWELVPPYSVVRIRARVVEDSVIGIPQAELVEFLGPYSSDAELNQAAVDLQKPVIQLDRQFGELTLNRSINWYTAKTEWNGATIALNVLVDDSGAIDSALEVARVLWKKQKQWAKRIEDYAVQELLSVKNDNWLDEGESELTADQFKARMTLVSVTVERDGSIEFWYDDGDLFWGHAIDVRGNISQGLIDAGISG